MDKSIDESETVNSKSTVTDISEIRLLQQSGQLPEAEIACRAMLKIQSSSQELIVLLAVILSQLQQYDEAKKLVKAHNGRYCPGSFEKKNGSCS